MAETREVHIEIRDRKWTAILRDVARAVGFRFRIETTPYDDLVVELVRGEPTRDQLAAMVMAAHVANGTDPEIVNPATFAAYCYRIADAMIEEAKKGAPRG